MIFIWNLRNLNDSDDDDNVDNYGGGDDDDCGCECLCDGKTGDDNLPLQNRRVGTWC